MQALVMVALLLLAGQQEVAPPGPAPAEVEAEPEAAVEEPAPPAPTEAPTPVTPTPAAQDPEPPPPPEEATSTEPSKKEKWLQDKATAARPAKRPPLRRAAIHPVTLQHVWTRERLPVAAELPPEGDQLSRFLRCHFTNQATTVDARLLPILLRAAKRFQQTRIEIVSAFRALKYNLMLRKKGHQVARDSAHPKGDAIDFRLPQVPTKTLMRFVKALRLGGVGYYPDSKFVHADTGRVRYWKGH